MARIAWRGKDVNLITVGQSKLYDYTTVQSALDAIEAAGDAALTNEYVIGVARGYWTNADAKIEHALSHVHIAAEHRGASVFLIDDSSYAGGVLIIAAGAVSTGNTVAVDNVIIDGLHLINNISGVGKFAAGPPEGALYVGEEAVHPNTGTIKHWDNIVISNCILDGVHDALQFFGIGADDDTGLCTVQGNLIRSNHDAFAVKGGCRIESNGNVIHAFSGSSAIPRLTNAADWKTTGMHLRTDAGYVNPYKCYLLSEGDQIYVRAEGNIGNTSTTPSQNVVAGILQYAVGPAYPMSFHGLIQVLFDEDYSPDHVCGILVRDTEETDPTKFRVNASTIRVHQINTGGSAPASIAGVRVRPDSGAASPVDPLTVTNCRIDVVNDGTPAGVYSLEAQTDTQTSQITQGGNYSPQGTAGTIHSLTALT